MSRTSIDIDIRMYVKYKTVATRSVSVEIPEPSKAGNNYARIDQPALGKLVDGLIPSIMDEGSANYLRRVEEGEFDE